MITTSTLQPGELRHHQNVVLFNGSKLTAFGTAGGSVILIVTLHGKYSTLSAFAWLISVNLVYFARFLDGYQFQHAKSPELRPEFWKKRFDIGMWLGGISWGSATWCLFPNDQPGYQALLVMSVCAVAYFDTSVTPGLPPSVIFLCTTEPFFDTS